MEIAKSATAFAVAAFTLITGHANAQEKPRYVQDYCVKVRDGKGADFQEFMKESAKMPQVMIDEGMYTTYVAAVAVSPAGRSARCDYHFVYWSDGFPPEPLSAEKVDAVIKKAGIHTSRSELLAKRNETSYLVSMDIFRVREGVGRAMKGGYLRVNYYKVKSGMMGDWLRLQSTSWKPLAEAWAKETPGTAWSVSTVVMPGGEGLPYNAITVDAFASWEALGKGMPVRSTWSKAHPDADLSGFVTRQNALSEQSRVDYFKLVDVLRKE